VQTGTITCRGPWWYLRYYKPYLKNGQVIKKQRMEKLVPFSPEYPTAESVRAAGLTGPILAPLNADEVNAGTLVHPTLLEFLQHVYLPHVKANHKRSTYKGYNDRFKLLRPYLGNTIEVRKVKTSDINRWLQAVANSKPRAKSTIKHLKAFLSGALRFAIGKDLIQHNPAHAALLPSNGVPPGETAAYSLDEVQTMLDALDGMEPSRTIFTVAAFTGLRVGEIEPLKWEDIQGSELRIERAIYKGHIDTTKTSSSEASIPLLPMVARALEEHRKRDCKGEFIFSGPRSRKPLNLENYRCRVIIPAFEKAGVRCWAGWHGFRRGLSTNLCELGVDTFTISRILRDSEEVVRRHYIKKVPKRSHRAMRKFAKAFENNLQQSATT
jgi:integrase